MGRACVERVYVEGVCTKEGTLLSLLWELSRVS